MSKINWLFIVLQICLSLQIIRANATEGYEPTSEDEGYEPAPREDEGDEPTREDEGYEPTSEDKGYEPTREDEGYETTRENKRYEPTREDEGYLATREGEPRIFQYNISSKSVIGLRWNRTKVRGNPHGFHQRMWRNRFTRPRVFWNKRKYQNRIRDINFHNE
uniref:Uncharacterized protein n=1 Tax=Clastoptera arizonana TaxID=38151 RepID=A0A1B6D7Q9_9HEMI